MEFVKHIDAPRGDVVGKELGDLVKHLAELQRFLEKLDKRSGLYLSNQDGLLLGELTKSELDPIVKRIREKIETKIKECKLEISQHVT